MSLAVERIAVFAPNKPFFGARLIQIPIYQHLRVNYPNAHIRIYSPVAEAEIFKNYSLADEILLYKKSSIKNIYTITKSLRTYRPDVIINCREFSEGLHLIVALARKAFKAGFTPGTKVLRFFYDKTIPYNPRQYRGSSYLQLVELLGLTTRFGFTRIKNLQTLSSLQLPEHEFVCLIPGGGEGEHKRWGIDNFLDFCEVLIKKKPAIRCYFILGFMEENFIAEIERRLPIESRAILFKGKLEDMIKVITHSRLTVANDCGPAHLAQMVGVPFASVWGNLDNNAQKRIAEWFYTRPHSTYIVAGTNESIKSISPESVYAATQAIQ